MPSVANLNKSEEVGTSPALEIQKNKKTPMAPKQIPNQMNRL